MREQYVKPTVLNADTMESTSVELKDSVLPLISVATAAYQVGKSVRKAVGASPSVQFPSFNHPFVS